MPLSNSTPRENGFVHHSIAIVYHEEPNPKITVRSFFIAVQACMRDGSGWLTLELKRMRADRLAVGGVGRAHDAAQQNTETATAQSDPMRRFNAAYRRIAGVVESPSPSPRFGFLSCSAQGSWPLSVGRGLWDARTISMGSLLRRAHCSFCDLGVSSVKSEPGALTCSTTAICPPTRPQHPVRPYSDEKVANREIRVWYFVIENGY